MSGNTGRRRLPLVLVLMPALLLASILVHDLDLRILLALPFLVAVWVAVYIAHRTDPSTRRFRRLSAIVLALGALVILATVVGQYLVVGIGPEHIIFAVMAVVLAVVAPWYWIQIELAPPP
jgi:hypothetical protein